MSGPPTGWAEGPLAGIELSRYPLGMFASLLAALLLASPARAATARVEAGAAVPLVAPLSAPVSAPAATLSASPGIASAPMPLAAAALTAPAPLPAAAPAMAAAPARTAASFAPAAAVPSAAPALGFSPAASVPTERSEETAAETASAVAPAPAGRIRRFLAAIVNPFGGGKAEAAPATEAERLDRAFAAKDVWSQIAPAARSEIERLRGEKKTKAEVKEYVRAEADAAVARILAARRMTNLGLHYNLHGGAREGYLNGINATMGDIALNYTIHGDRNYKVYFFQTEKYRLYDILNESNPAQLVFPSRMGNNLSVFDLNAPPLVAARSDGRIKNFGQISMDFHGMKGVPYSAFLAPPLEVFHGTAKRIGMKKLTRDEETLATVRYLEAALLAGGAYVPSN